jgi:hypothetical protein
VISSELQAVSHIVNEDHALCSAQEGTLRSQYANCEKKDSIGCS